MSYDKFRVPVHGVPYPSLENPANLFQRQLKIEEHSFEFALTKYKTQLKSLVEIGRAHELGSSSRFMLKWIRDLDRAISEQQNLMVKR